ncbi:hypothetical protein EON66_02410 [archaeon]|nr:MAG: hypothetical protein EON66_02410 [archaeon]
MQGGARIQGGAFVILYEGGVLPIGDRACAVRVTCARAPAAPPPPSTLLCAAILCTPCAKDWAIVLHRACGAEPAARARCEQW